MIYECISTLNPTESTQLHVTLCNIISKALQVTLKIQINIKELYKVKQTNPWNRIRLQYLLAAKYRHVIWEQNVSTSVISLYPRPHESNPHFKITVFYGLS
jgi:hypothetical protein